MQNNLHSLNQSELIVQFMRQIPFGDQVLIKKAIEFALDAHKGQTRSGGAPYSNHVLRVGLMAAEYAKKNEPYMLASLTISALLHDTVEDTDVTLEDIENEFGGIVADLVSALTHEYEEEPDEVYLARVARGGKYALLIKRFDRIDNILDLANAEPSFCEIKIAELEKALPLWQTVDLVTAHQIRLAIQKVRGDKN